MVEENNVNKILTIILALVICVSAIIVLYVNLPKDETKDDNIEEAVNVLTIIYDDKQINYTIDEIKSMASYTGQGAKINKKFTITGPYNFTGVKISTFLSEFENLPSNYSIDTTSVDGYSQHYTYNQIQGSVEKLNETGVSLGNANFTMIIAFMQEDEELIDSEDGPLMIVFVDDYYTDSGLWAKQLSLIEIREE